MSILTDFTVNEQENAIDSIGVRLGAASVLGQAPRPHLLTLKAYPQEPEVQSQDSDQNCLIQPFQAYYSHR